MVRCIIKSCNSGSSRKDENITFHRLPSEPALRALWINAIGRPNCDITKGFRVCSKHFEGHCFRRTEKSTSLRPGTVPKLFLQVESKLKKKTIPAKRESHSVEETDSTDSSYHDDDSKDLRNNKEKSTEARAKRDFMSSLCTINDSPRAKKLKQDIFLLRKKSRADGIKIKCIQNKIRRILRKQSKMPRGRRANIGRRTRHASQQQVYSQNISEERQNIIRENPRLRQRVSTLKEKTNEKTSPQSDRDLKRRRSSADDSDTDESLPRSPSASFVGRMNFETDAESEALSIKCEPIYDGDMVAGPSAASTDATSGLREGIIMIEEIKIEENDDPLLMFSGANG